jgi:hypothetical protein
VLIKKIDYITKQKLETPTGKEEQKTRNEVQKSNVIK